MTPCEELGYKVGDVFVVDKEYGIFTVAFSIGSTIELEMDDGSEIPLFKLLEGECGYEFSQVGLGAYQPLTHVTKL